MIKRGLLSFSLSLFFVFTSVFSKIVGTKFFVYNKTQQPVSLEKKTVVAEYKKSQMMQVEPKGVQKLTIKSSFDWSSYSELYFLYASSDSKKQCRLDCLRRGIVYLGDGYSINVQAGDNTPTTPNKMINGDYALICGEDFYNTVYITIFSEEEFPVTSNQDNR